MTCPACQTEFDGVRCSCGYPPQDSDEATASATVKTYGKIPTDPPPAFTMHVSEPRTDQHLTKEQFGDVLFECIKAFAGRAQVRKTAHLLMKNDKLSDTERTRRLADCAKREQDLTKQIDEMFPFLDEDDQVRLIHDYEQVPDGV